MKYLVSFIAFFTFSVLSLTISYAAQSESLPPINQINCKLTPDKKIFCTGFDVQLFKIQEYQAKLKKNKFHVFNLKAGFANYRPLSHANHVVLIFENVDGWVRIATKTSSIGPDKTSSNWREVYPGRYVCHSLTERVYCPLIFT